MNFNALNEKARQLKLRMLQMCIKAGFGHVTSALSCAEILTALYYDRMNIDRSNPEWAERDRLFLSKNHASVMLYPIFADFGWIDDSELDQFGSDDRRLGCHSKFGIPGIDFAGGSLGIGLGVACGSAYAAKCDNKSWKNYAVVGDGECYEGSIWEAAMFAGHNKLDNLIVFLDRNRQCATDFNEKLLRQEPFEDKWRAFGWYVDRIDGHDIKKIVDATQKAVGQNIESKPIMIVCDTVKGHGIDFMEDRLYLHGVTPKGEKAKSAIRQLGGAADE